ncbi:ABC transporter substrate-binding protein [Roseateles chitosanitabidus]|uniref:ABC transporter substrate-binding protein n=1 Tax=Roseateles chitosanitabidus TaxID=65048 RepID=UPI000A016EA0|nr:ABC transporter substrate-binding protein [Roseateles chitosanitabidus]
MSSGLWSASRDAQGWRGQLARGTRSLARGTRRGLALLAAGATAVLLAACNNSPYPAGSAKDNTLYLSFDERSPRYLDPTASYTSPESVYTYQIMEPPYGYHYLKRPYELIPRAAARVIKPYYLNAAGQRLPDDAPVEQIAQSVYDVPIRPGTKYAPSPAFAKDEQGHYRYHHLTAKDLGDKRSPWQFAHQGTRELEAEDFVYAIKRQATTRVEAPIFGLFSEHVIGLKAYGELIRAENAKLLQGLPESSPDKPFLDFRRWPLEGAEAVDKHTLRIRIKGKYPQWSYWLSTTFLAPVPWEVDLFYAQPGMAEHGLSWNQWPVGTGPYMMTEYQQDRRHVMSRNPNYRKDDLYPCEGMPDDGPAGRLADCGKPMPFIDKIVATLVKERVPRKELFKQGYLDVPDLERGDWGVEFYADASDSREVEDFFKQRGFAFPRSTDPNNWYLGFNMLDPVIGKGKTAEDEARHRKLRQALSIAIDWEEGYGRIFKNRGGVTAFGPVPPGVFGSREAQRGFFNPVTHKIVDGQVQRRSLDDAKQLMAEAGYPDGRDAKTGQPLVLNYDFMRTVTPEVKAENDWLVKQFAKLGIQLDVRATDYNQFQEKVRQGKHQVFWWGWFADYPDAENFLFLLYGPNSKSLHEGENSANYENLEYDRLFKQVQVLDDGPEKQKVIDRMVEIVQQDAPWAFGYWAWTGQAYQSWVHNGKPSIVIRDPVRYYRIDPARRAALQSEWNHPVWWPLLVLVVGGVAIVWMTRRSFQARETATARGTAAPTDPVTTSTAPRGAD